MSSINSSEHLLPLLRRYPTEYARKLLHSNKEPCWEPRFPSIDGSLELRKFSPQISRSGRRPIRTFGISTEIVLVYSVDKHLDFEYLRTPRNPLIRAVNFESSPIEEQGSRLQSLLRSQWKFKTHESKLVINENKSFAACYPLEGHRNTKLRCQLS